MLLFLTTYFNHIISSQQAIILQHRVQNQVFFGKSLELIWLIAFYNAGG